MKFISFFYAVLLLSSVLYSCSGKISGEDSIDSIVIEDFFEVDVFKPNDDVKKAIGESLMPLISNRLDYSRDSTCIQIECHAIWDASRNTNPYSIKINEIDTNWFFLTINEGLDTEISIDWDRLSDRQILRTIKTILDSGTYSLCCINFDNVTSQSILNRYHNFGSIARTDINFKMWLRKGVD